MPSVMGYKNSAVDQRRTHSSMVNLLCLVFAISAAAVDYQALHSEPTPSHARPQSHHLRLEVVGGEASLLVRVRC